MHLDPRIGSTSMLHKVISHPSQRSSNKPSQELASQSSTRSLRHTYLSKFYVLLHDYIRDIIYVDVGGNYGFSNIGDLLEWGKQFWLLVRMKLDDEVFHNKGICSNLFYDTISNIKSSLKISNLGVHYLVRDPKYHPIPTYIVSAYVCM